MCADWYTPLTLYGYSFAIPNDVPYRTTVKTLLDISVFVTPPFTILGLLPTFHSRLEFDEHHNRNLDHLGIVVIGFKPDPVLERTMTLANELSEYVRENPVLTGFDIVLEPNFFTGIPWPMEKDGFEESDSSYSTSEIESVSDDLDFDNYSVHPFHGEDIQDLDDEDEESEDGDWEVEENNAIDSDSSIH